MTEKIFRNYLEIKSLEDFKEVEAPSQYSFVELLNPKDFQLNKFFYKNVGKNHRWIDRLIWTDLNWIEYVSNKKLFTYVLKEKNEIQVITNCYFMKIIKRQKLLILEF